MSLSHTPSRVPHGNHFASRRAATLAAIGLLLACGGGGDGPTSVATDGVVTLSDLSPATIAVGGTMFRTVTITIVSGSAGPLQWSSDNPAVAAIEPTVSTAVTVRGVAPGSATLRASVGGTIATTTITVLDPAFDRLVLNGGRHACAQTSDNKAFCWGDDGERALAQIADPEVCPEQRRPCATTPRLLPTSQSFVRVAVGHGGQSCGLTVDGTAYCWGNNFADVVGTSSEICEVPLVSPFPCIAAPTPVRGSVKFAALSLGGSFCGLTAQGAAYCWGQNDFGQLGDGTNTLRVAPTPVSGGIAFSSLSVGAWQACGLTADGTAYCWGANGVGQLGDGSTTDRTTPVAVSGGYKFLGISPAREHTCGVTTAGAVYCWGDNQFGQLGDGTTTGSAVPKQVSAAASFVSVTAGLEHTCALTTSNRAWCWGQNSGPQVQGQLGDGTTTSRLVPVAVARDLAFVELRAGRAFTCGRTANGKIYCWGDNRFGQLGSGELTRRNSTTPVGVAGLP
jgi:alpha-tubulin suppressor-like RCC1 family protein